MSSKTSEYAEATFNDALEKATTAYTNLQSKLGAMRLCQKEISRANIKTCISAKLRELQYRGQYQIQRRNMIRQAIPVMEKCSQIYVEISELERTFYALSHKSETASHCLQYVCEEHDFMANQA